MKRILIAIVGPTAVGKTRMSIRVAQHYHTEIISADARQFYEGMRIGTAAPSGEQLLLVKHHFVNELPVTAHYSAGDFEKDALRELDLLFGRHNVVVLAGGSGLFVRALIKGLDTFPEVNQQVVKQLKAILEEKGIDALRLLLREHDPEYAGEVDLNNPHRLLRALSVCISSGKPYSSFRKEKDAIRNFETVLIGLQMDRKKLYERIDARVDQMMEDGLLEEVKALLPFIHANALQTVGYQELFSYLQGTLTLEAAVSQIKQHSRNYAKRQLTWFRREPGITWFDAEDESGIISYIDSYLQQQ